MVMGLINAGYFRELCPSWEDAPSMREAIRSPGPDDEAIVRYLDAGAALAVSGSMEDDCLDPSRKGVAHLAILTDGQWAWPKCLSYYMAEYHIQISLDFVDHMSRQGWVPPSFTREELTKISKENRGSMGLRPGVIHHGPGKVRDLSV
jgi:hypothetical protein